jgi:two-component system response regulator NreC
MSSKQHSDLSEREIQVLQRIILGYTRAEIAKDLVISAKTVGTYRGRIYEKLKLHSRAQLVRYAIEQGFISVPSHMDVKGPRAKAKRGREF